MILSQLRSCKVCVITVAYVNVFGNADGILLAPTKWFPMKTIRHLFKNVAYGYNDVKLGFWGSHSCETDEYFGHFSVGRMFICYFTNFLRDLRVRTSVIKNDWSLWHLIFSYAVYAMSGNCETHKFNKIYSKWIKCFRNTVFMVFIPALMTTHNSMSNPFLMAIVRRRNISLCFIRLRLLNHSRQSHVNNNAVSLEMLNTHSKNIKCSLTVSNNVINMHSHKIPGC